MSDKQWIQQIIAGDMTAFSSIVSKYERMVFTLAFRIVKNRELAEEVTQDSFLKAYNALTKFRGESRFSTWLYRITYRTAITAIRRNVFTVELGETTQKELTDSDYQSGLELLEMSDKRVMIEGLLQRLPTDESLLLTLYYLQECSVREIVMITELSESNIKVKLYRARKHFYNEISQMIKKQGEFEL